MDKNRLAPLSNQLSPLETSVTALLASVLLYGVSGWSIKFLWNHFFATPYGLPHIGFMTAVAAAAIIYLVVVMVGVTGGGAFNAKDDDK